MKQERQGGDHHQIHNQGVPVCRTVAEQVDQYLLFDVEMDEDISSTKLGLAGEEAESIQEMQPDILEIAQGEEDYCACSCCVLTVSIISHNYRFVLHPPYIWFGGCQEDCCYQNNNI